MGAILCSWFGRLSKTSWFGKLTATGSVQAFEQKLSLKEDADNELVIELTRRVAETVNRTQFY